VPHAPDREPLAFETIEDIVAAVRRHGGRLSAPRRLILEALFAAEGPVSAERLAQAVAGRGERVDLSSVYRSLEHLEQLGAVRHVHLGHGPALYALTGAGDQEYLTCERCGRVTAVDPAQLDPVRDLVRERFGYRVRFTHFPITGVCPSCAGDRSGHRR
jgi:Fur family ferric uptake transcriptional regulator